MDIKSAIYNLINHNKEIPMLPNREKYKVAIPVIPDIHILYKEPTNRTNFIPTTLSYLFNLADIFEANRFDYAIQTGDLHDRGNDHTDTFTRNAVETALREMRSHVKDFYITYGNHEHTYMQNNLFFSYTDIKSSILKEIIGDKNTLKPVNPIFQAVDKISFGDLNINFMHFDPLKRYTVDPTGYNICIFHDDLISFDSKVELYHHKLGHGISITDTNILENVNVAICGHVHVPIIPFTMSNVRNTLFVSSGSLCQRSVAEKHSRIDIPVICINEEGVVIEYIPFNLGNIQDTVITEITTKQKKVRESNKKLKNFTKVYGNAQDLEDMINSLPPFQAEIVKNADKQLYPLTLSRYYDRYIAKQNAI